MRYIVVFHRDVMLSELVGPDEIREEDDEVDHKEVSRVVLCEDSRAVARAIRAPREGEEWAGLFENVGGEARRRAVVRKMDGLCLYDVEIS